MRIVRIILSALCLCAIGTPVYTQSPVRLALDFTVDESVQYDARNFRTIVEAMLKQTKRDVLILESTPQTPLPIVSDPASGTPAYRITGTIQPQEEMYCTVEMEVFDSERNKTLFNVSIYSTTEPDILYQTIEKLADKALDSLVFCIDQKAEDHLILIGQENKELEKRIAALNQHNQDLAKRLSEFTQWGEDLGERVGALNRRNQDLGERVNALNQRNQELDDYIGTLSQRNEDLTTQLDSVDHSNQELYAQLEMLQNLVSPALPENFVSIPAGTFVMGSLRSEASRDSDELQRTITISAFFMGRSEVTQKEWQELMENNPSRFQGSDLPVENISWFDAVEYCNRRSLEEGLRPAYTIDKTSSKWNVIWNKDANGYRLPTEAEWEYACRAGTRTAFYTGDSLRTEDANFDGMVAYNGVKSGYKSRTTKVEEFAPNPWGLFDMHGNVWEWCWDWYGAYADGPQSDPDGAKTGVNRIMRGGSWNFYAQYLRSANRGSNAPSYHNYDLGLRLVRP